MEAETLTHPLYPPESRSPRRETEFALDAAILLAERLRSIASRRDPGFPMFHLAGLSTRHVDCDCMECLPWTY